MKHNVGPAGLEPAVHLRSGFTVHAATNYRLRAQEKTDVHFYNILWRLFLKICCYTSL